MSIRDYHTKLEKIEVEIPDWASSNGLSKGTENTKEVPTRVGLALTGFYLFATVSLLTVLFFILLLILIPKYDNIVDARLGDDYKNQFSSSISDHLGIPEMQQILSMPKVTDMDQGNGHVYLATLGHGIQKYNKDNSLWKTIDAKSTKGEIKNDIQEIRYQQKEGEKRLWVLGLEGGIALGKFNDDENIEFKRLYATKPWRYITRDEITTTIMVNDNYVVFGTSLKGAGIYNTDNHDWQDLPEIKDHTVKRIIYKKKDALLWFLTNQGVSVYEVENNNNKELSFSYLKHYHLEVPDLIDLRVFSKDKAVVLTEYQGCYIFEQRWSDKLLGGFTIPGLTQEAIKHTAYWKGLLVAAGESFGVSGYNPDDRNWVPLIVGELPTFTDFDFDNDTIIVATIDGIFVRNESKIYHLLKDNIIKKVSLSEKGLLYIISGEDGISREVGWIQTDGSNRKVLIGNDALPINNQPQINDVIIHGGAFWLATDHGVIRYTLEGRKLELLDKSESGTISQVKKIKKLKNRIILLADQIIYGWTKHPVEEKKDATPGKWNILYQNVKNFRIDPVTQNLWIHKSDNTLVHLIKDNSFEEWFTGTGPHTLDLAATNGVVLISGQESSGFKAYFPVKNENKMYLYDSVRSSWQEPYNTPTHPFTLFAPQIKPNLFTLNSNTNQIYFNADTMIGKGTINWPLDNALWAQQDKSKISLFGPTRRSDYEPKKGKWTNNERYPFLKTREQISKLYSLEYVEGGKLAKTTNNRLLLLSDQWKSFSEVGNAVYGDHFDGQSFWNLSNGSLIGQTVIKNKNNNFTIEKSDYFNGRSPDLSRILEAWTDSSGLNIVTPNYWTVYDTKFHTWEKKSFSQGPLIRADFDGNTLEAINHNRVYKLSLPDMKGDSIWLPSGQFKKLDSYRGQKVVTVKNNNRNQSYYRSENQWKSLIVNRSKFSGNLNAISKIFTLNQNLWVYQHPGTIGRYMDGSWDAFSISKNFKFSAFWKKPKGLLFLIGKQGTSKIELPLYFFHLGKLQPLSPLPKNIAESRIEKDRYLWLKRNNGDILIYDLEKPFLQGLNISKIYKQTRSKITTQFLFNFKSKTFTKLPLFEKNSEWRTRIQREGIEGIHIQRNEKSTQIFIKTKSSIYAIKSENGSWYLIGEYRVTGEMDFDKAVNKIILNNHPSDPVDFNMGQVDFLLALAKVGDNPINNFIENGAAPGQFASLQNSIDYSKFNNPKSVTVNGVNISVNNNQTNYQIRVKSSSRPLPLPHTNGRFEIDQPFIDATVNFDGAWVVLRRKSITVYNNPNLYSVVDYGVFDSQVSRNSFIEAKDGKLLIHKPNGVFEVSISNGQATLIPYKPIEKIYSQLNTGLKVEKSLTGVKVYIKNKQFKGNGKFSFDRLQRVAASKSKIFLMTSNNKIWSFKTEEGFLSSSNFYPIASALPNGRKTFTNCNNGEAKLAIGKKLFILSPEFKESSRDDCSKPARVASEDSWEWFLNSTSKGIFFKAKIDNKWVKKKRQNKQGKFLDDIFTWLIRFNNKFYAAHRLGITRISENGKNTNFITGKKMQELKIFEGSLYSMDKNSKTYKLSGQNSWDKITNLSARRIFNRFTELYSDPFLKMEGLHGKIRFKTRDGDLLKWDNKLRKFQFDLFKDFAVTDNRLFTLDGQNLKIVSYRKDGNRSGYYHEIGSIQKFQAKGKEWLAISSRQSFQWVETEKKWEETDVSNIILAARGNLHFQKKLFPRHGSIQIYPVIEDNSVPKFWSDGRFSFDKIQKLAASGDKNWWAATDSGLIHFENVKEALIKKMYPTIKGTSRIRYKNNQLNLAINDAEFYLDEDTGELRETNTVLFTKTVFDYIRENNVYTWKVDEVADQNSRPAFYIHWQQNKNDPNVFYKNRFFWDQIIRAAYEPEAEQYWIVTPMHMTINTIKKSQNKKPELMLNAFYETKLKGFSMDHYVLLSHQTAYGATPYRDPAYNKGPVKTSTDTYTIADAAFVDKTLFTLFTNQNNDNEVVQKKVNSEWVIADRKEYPFWHPRVDFSLKYNLWSPKKLTHSQFYASHNTFAFEGPDNYPLFSELDYAEGYGKFSFDYIRSIHPLNDTVWAGTEGGLLELVYLKSENLKKLRMKRIILPEDGLSYYAVDKIKNQKDNVIWALENSRGGNEVIEVPAYDESPIFYGKPYGYRPPGSTYTPSRKNFYIATGQIEKVQEIEIPAWQPIEDKELPGKREKFLNISSNIKYILEYDPIEDTGFLFFQWSEKNRKNRVRLLKYSPAIDPMKNLLLIEKQKHYFSFNGETIEIDLSSIGSEDVFKSLTQKKNGLKMVFTKLFVDKSGIEWGEIQNNIPAMRTPNGKIYEITGVADIKGLKVDENGMVWVFALDKKEESFAYDATKARVTKINNVKEGIIWEKYKTPPGMSISLYLLDNKIVEKQNFFKRIFGTKHTELERWVLKIVKTNNIQQRGEGALDYYLEVDKIYDMPKKAFTVTGDQFNPEYPLALNNNSYKFNTHKKSDSDIIMTDYGTFGFTEKYFLQFDMEQNRVALDSFPTELIPHHLWKEKNGRILMSFMKKKESNNADIKEVWQYVPFKFNSNKNILPTEFKQIYVTNWNKKLEAADKNGFFVGDDKRKKHITKSSEWLFGTNIKKVIEILKDSKGNGYWIATDTSGLIWSENPF